MWIMLGLFSFAFGHICYLISLFVNYYVSGHKLFIILPFVTSFVLIVLYMIISYKAGIRFSKKMLPFSLFYLLCLTSMTSTSFYMALLHNFSSVSVMMFFIGAVFFMASDFMLTGSYFKAGQRSKPYLAIYSICYYVAQFTIAFSIFFIK